jgi:hypothetical protein
VIQPTSRSDPALPDPAAPALPEAPALLGQLYAQAAAPLRSSLLDQLLRPLGLLSLVVVAGGAFARLKSRSGWHDGPPPLEHLRDITPADVVALAKHVQQVSAEVVDALLRSLATSPTLTGSATAALMAVLYARSRRRRAADPGR